MSPLVISLALASALLTAVWYAIIKSAPDKSLTTVLVTGIAGLLATALAPFLPQPTLASLPYISASSCFQVLAYIASPKRTHTVT